MYKQCLKYNPFMKHIIPLIIIILLSGCYSRNPDKTDLEGKPIPSFKILLTDSTTYLDTKDIQSGHPLVLFYYSPSCPYSRAQMEEMVENMSIMKKYQFLILTPAPFRQMKLFYSQFNLNKYKNVIVGLDNTKFISDYYKVTGVPFTIIFNDQKKMISAFTGKIYVKQIIHTINT